MEMLIGFRFLAGCFGTAPIVNGGGTIADIMPPEKRGGAMAVWAIGPLLGPVLGPIIGAFITQREGWRWAFWTIAIIAGIASIVAFFLTNETYAPVLLERKVNRLRKATGINSFHSTLQLDITPAERWRRSLLRPMKLMFFSIICALMSLYMAIVYGILYLLFTTFTFVFEERYGFSQSIVGLVYVSSQSGPPAPAKPCLLSPPLANIYQIGLGVGNMLGLAVLAVFSDTVMQRLANKHSNGIVKPEHRLPMLIYSGPVIPVGIFLYGWTVAYQVSLTIVVFAKLVLIPVLGPLDRAARWHSMYWLWSYHGVYVYQYLSGRRIYPLRCFCYSRHYGSALYIRMCISTFRLADVQGIGPWVGK